MPSGMRQSFESRNAVSTSSSSSKTARLMMLDLRLIFRPVPMIKTALTMSSHCQFTTGNNQRTTTSTNTKPIKLETAISEELELLNYVSNHHHHDQSFGRRRHHHQSTNKPIRQVASRRKERFLVRLPLRLKVSETSPPRPPPNPPPSSDCSTAAAANLQQQQQRSKPDDVAKVFRDCFECKRKIQIQHIIRMQSDLTVSERRQCAYTAGFVHLLNCIDSDATESDDDVENDVETRTTLRWIPTPRASRGGGGVGRLFKRFRKIETNNHHHHTNKKINLTKTNPPSSTLKRIYGTPSATDEPSPRKIAREDRIVGRRRPNVRLKQVKVPDFEIEKAFGSNGHLVHQIDQNNNNNDDEPEFNADGNETNRDPEAVHLKYELFEKFKRKIKCAPTGSRVAPTGSAVFADCYIEDSKHPDRRVHFKCRIYSPHPWTRRYGYLRRNFSTGH